MKKGRLLNAELSHVIARLGHTDTLTIADAGLPIPAGPQRIDLALTPGTPDFMQVVNAVVLEMQVESALIAEEIKQHNPQLHSALVAVLEALQQHQGISSPSATPVMNNSNNKRSVVRRSFAAESALRLRMSSSAPV